MRVVFELTMPGVGSWNGKWSGEGKRFTMSRNITRSDCKGKPWLGTLYDAVKSGESRSFKYDFGDGWAATVTVRKPEQRERISGKFCGYEWMIESILEHGMITPG